MLFVRDGQEEKQEVKQGWVEESKTENDIFLEANAIGFGKLTVLEHLSWAIHFVLASPMYGSGVVATSVKSH